MKRSQPLERGTALRVDPAKVRAFVQRNRRALPVMSAKRKAEQSQRDAVRRVTLERAGHRCQAADVWPEIRCRGPLDVDEKVSRGVRPGAHLDERLTQALCRAHHEARTRQPDEARRRGLRWTSTEAPR